MEGTFSLSAESLSFTSSSSSKELKITSNQSWTASSSASWLTLSKTSGTGDATVSITAGTNSSFVSREGKVTFTAGGTSYEVSVTQEAAEEHYEKIDGHYYVDLGLPSGLLWATMNVGASTAEDYGGYYAWGETTTKNEYNWGTYKWGNYDPITKYNTDNAIGTVDNKTMLDLADDAARANWGGSWRMPTYDDWNELRDTVNCTWTLTIQNGVNGCKVTSKSNGRSLFLPAAGWFLNTNPVGAGTLCTYWSSSLSTDSPRHAGNYLFGWNDYLADFLASNYWGGRSLGLSVRPVWKEESDYLDVFSAALSFTASGGTEVITLTTNQNWTASCDVSWLTLSVTSGTGDATVSVAATANTSTDSRTGTITFKAGGSSYEVAVTQTGISGTFSVTPMSRSFTSSGGSESFAVTSNLSWTVSSGVSWLTLSKTSGTGNATVTAKAEANTSTDSRKGTITFKAGGSSYQVAVAQSGQSNPNPGTHDYVDLGLPSGLLWATMNVGASSPEEYGDHFAWGETTTKSDYSWSAYKWCKGSYNTLTKYNTDISYGTVDNKTVFDLSDDAARASWGGIWRMPTDEEWTELREKCTWTWTSQGGHYGSKGVGPNGNSIFIPAAGYRRGTSLLNAGAYGDYWSSSLNAASASYAWTVSFFSGDVNRSNRYRANGLSVRPVCRP